MLARWMPLVVVACVACAGRPAGERLSAPAEPEASDGTEVSGEAREGEPAPPALQPILAAHDRVRAEHCAPPLVWSDELASSAREWADRLARQCALEHSGGAIGENLSMATEGVLDAEGVVELWYREREHYDFRRGGFSMETGHFTQVVWKETRSLGCATASCRGLEVWVCHYDPAGNVRGEYEANVLPTSCR